MESRPAYLLVIMIILLVAVISGVTFSLTGLTANEGVISSEIVPPEVSSPASQNEVNDLRGKVNELQLQVDNLLTAIEKNEQDINRLGGNIQALSAQISQLQSLGSRLDAVSTGLAGLQKNVSSEILDLKVNTKQRRIISIIAYFVVLSLIGLVAFYFYNRSAMPVTRATSEGNPKVIDYITRHIQQGRKYHHIKQALLNAGWSELDVEKAYQDMLTRNSPHYKKKTSAKDSESNKLKLVGLVGVAVIFLGLAVFFIFGGTTAGQAYQKYGGTEDYEEGTGLNRVLSERQCFAPRVMIGGQCCDDRNQNAVCDSQEGYTEISTASLTGNLVITAATPQDTVQNRQIAITSNGFVPQQLNVVTGDLIEFTNNRSEPARVIPGQGCPPMNGGLIPRGGMFSWTPVNPGSCSISVGIGASNEACQENNHCASGRSCVDNQCKFIADIYQTQTCNEYCTIIRIKITTFNQGASGSVISQNYTLRMGLGSYTTGGALDWTIKPVPDFCKPSSAARIHQESNTWRATIPIPFELREFSNSNLLGTRVETINTGQQKVITHRTLDLDGFTLKVEDVHLTCGAQTVFG